MYRKTQPHKTSKNCEKVPKNMKFTMSISNRQDEYEHQKNQKKYELELLKNPKTSISK